MKTLKENEWMPAVFPNVQGRILASVRIIRTPDVESVPQFIIDTEPATHERVLETISRFTLAGDFKVTDITRSAACISIQGPAAVDLAERSFSIQLDRNAQVQTYALKAEKLLLVQANHFGTAGFDVFTDAASAIDVWERLLAGGAQPVGMDISEVLRIEAGIPRFGVDITEDLVVSETNLDDAVSFTKGCYIGQEIIARIKYRGHVAKKITGITFDDRVSAGAKVFGSDEKEIGRLTSVAFSPTLGKWISIGLIRFQYLEIGTQVVFQEDGRRVSGVVAALPFVFPH